MAIHVIPERVQRVWNKCNLRTAVLSSLCVQILLIFLSPMRRRTRGILLSSIIWSCYLMADWVATYAIGIIVSNQNGDSCDDDKCVETALMAFWAPFLLLHLGGPDSITAFSLEDNELWMRHMFGLIVELVMVAYVFSLAIPSAFWLSSILVFVAGTVKYVERTRSLYLACLGNLKDSMRSDPDPGRDYAQFMEEYAAMKEAQFSVGISSVPEPVFCVLHALTDTMTSDDDRTKEMAALVDGYSFYKIFRGLIVDHMFSFHDYRDSSGFVTRLKPEDAFKVMAIELNFMYDELFTKMGTLHRAGYFGFFLRFTCIVSIVIALVLFALQPKKSLDSFDVAFTYALLIGAIFLDFIAAIKLVFSDWTMALLQHHPKALEGIYPIYRRISYNLRWSESITQYSLIRYCMIKKSRRRSEIWFDKVVDCFGLKSTFEELRYKQGRHVNQGLKEFIYNGLREKSEGQPSMRTKDILFPRGDHVLLRYGIKHESVEESASRDIGYDESVLLWHIATDLLYFTFGDNNQEEGSSRTVPPHDGDDDCQDHREICKILSNYMLYLFIMRPSLMSTVAGICRIRFEDTCAEAMRFFDRDPLLSKESDACSKLLSVNTECSPKMIKGDGSKSVLFDACILAKGLKSITNDKKLMWEIMSNVWLELLCYGAINCRGDAHAQQLSKGGELSTFVWLLMAHFGLRNQFMNILVMRKRQSWSMRQHSIS